ncbi:hypothetical protein [Deinococcus misasensis]|uniref:hypothetical protein n=1 Tax=Deinococcus misasensis TaxID=392413 RepID=UPI000558A1E0|nr:hypothetical protein [Deinococcus misasensis]
MPEEALPEEVQAHVLKAQRLSQEQAALLEQQHGRVFRFVRRYMQEQGVNMQHQQESVFTATRCVQCKRAVVFFDTSRFIPQASRYNMILRPNPQASAGSRRHQFVNVCPYCGRWHGKRMIEHIHQRNRDSEEQTCLIFSGQQYLLWLEIQFKIG